MKLNLPPSIASTQDLASLTAEIHEYARWSVHESIKKQVKVSGKAMPPTMSPAANELIRNWVRDANIDELIDALKNYAATASSVNITLAAPPSSGIKNTLVTWCRENISPTVLVTFQFNATLLGGMVVQHGSRVFDWSFRRQILAERQRFPEVLRNV